ncbi:CYTH domain-containing protein [Streptomyces sp. NPDC050743]|uniref:CYTH domain-containing protein n=1 Tax=Streptomyces sp. NPDC050743 TaxID=3365634 RepID=UPI0037913481
MNRRSSEQVHELLRSVKISRARSPMVNWPRGLLFDDLPQFGDDLFGAALADVSDLFGLLGHGFHHSSAGLAEITYKPPSTVATHSAHSVISKSETNVRLDSASQAALANQLLENIGMRLLVRVEKHRETYRHALHPDVTVSIDTVAGVGTFVETEVISANATQAALRAGHVEKGLDVADLPIVDVPYRDLALAHVAAP